MNRPPAPLGFRFQHRVGVHGDGRVDVLQEGEVVAGVGVDPAVAEGLAGVGHAGALPARIGRTAVPAGGAGHTGTGDGPGDR